MNPPRPTATATATATATRQVPAAVEGTQRLLPAGGAVPVLLPDHLDKYGMAPHRRFTGRGALATMLREAGLVTRDERPRPVHAELTRSRGPRCLLTVTASREKDRALLWLVPHLVLDGIQLTTVALGTRRCRLELADQPNGRLRSLLHAELSRRAEACADVTRVTIATPHAASGAAAYGGAASGGAASGGADRGELRLDAETIAHIALIGRYGARWFREAGTRERPGTELREIPLDDGRSDVVEVRAAFASSHNSG